MRFEFLIKKGLSYNTLYPASGRHKPFIHTMRLRNNTINGVFEPTITHYKRAYHKNLHHENTTILICNSIVSRLYVDCDHRLDVLCYERHDAGSVPATGSFDEITKCALGFVLGPDFWCKKSWTKMILTTSNSLWSVMKLNLKRK